ncbi:Lsr2 family protein [Microbacterium oxydans]|uniref:histone-like nucleoid-structuring protein Lsr2 n=1 Tax=Microbacterium sp. B19(2022) TaxID=2914045 RepID=UPI0014321D4C|nr:Lsr2 family protein [Microbacterium sp. B19(2022)]NJI58610.1 Lsr2 family protein [Microbacterium sp. B19(2022)]
MAKKTVTTYVYTDDLTGAELEEGDVRTVEFSYGSRSYSIDLSEENATALDTALQPYIAAGRAIRKTPRKRSAVPSSEIREWGWSLPTAERTRLFPSERGALRKDAIEAYNALHGTNY